MDDLSGSVFTLVDGSAWRHAEAIGWYEGGADDRRDGFLHFSTAAQLRASAAKHRVGHADLWLVEADAAALGAALRWEKASGSTRPGVFPHLYAALPVAAVRRAVFLPLGSDGLHVFPADIP